MTTRRTPQSVRDESQQNGDTEKQQRIRKRAHELYEQRGRQEGLAEQDWLAAEAEILGQSYKVAA